MYFYHFQQVLSYFDVFKGFLYLVLSCISLDLSAVLFLKHSKQPTQVIEHILKSNTDNM